MLKVLTVIGIILVCYGGVFFSYKKLSGQNRKKIKIENKSQDILQIIESNNNYPPMLDVFNSLSENLSKYEKGLNADMRGYLDYDDTK